ncbi:hypothetical protein ACVOMV_26435 (plasmid) [Mesorhizobium atlanticum]
MQDFIARENIRRFRRILQEDLTDKERQTVLRLLQAEEEKLARTAASSTARESDT